MSYPNQLKNLIENIKTKSDMTDIMNHPEYGEYCQSLADYNVGKTINVHDKMQTNYSYTLSEEPGQNFAEGFDPPYSPGEMLALGVFEGKYLNDCLLELPREWYEVALEHGRLSPEKPDVSVNLFEIKSRQSLQVWRANGWIPITEGDEDVRGWFQWYCRYWLGRRQPNFDEVQIKRWRAFKRHLGQVKKNCTSGDMTCRPRQRQGLIQWAYDPFV